MELITLNPEDNKIFKESHIEVYKKTQAHISEIEKFLKEPMESSIPELVVRAGKAANMQGSTGIIVKNSTGLLSIAKGVAAQKLISLPEFTSLKDTMVRTLMSSCLANFEALSAQSERTIKALDKYTDLIRSIISAEKSLAEKVGHQ